MQQQLEATQITLAGRSGTLHMLSYDRHFSSHWHWGLPRPACRTGRRRLPLL